MKNLFPETSDLPALQSYMKAVCAERGWDQNSPAELFLLLTEEIGELAKALRHRTGLHVEAGKEIPADELAGEFADVLAYLLDLANVTGIDLAQAFREKEAINAGRKWD